MAEQQLTRKNVASDGKIVVKEDKLMEVWKEHYDEISNEESTHTKLFIQAIDQAFSCHHLHILPMSPCPYISVEGFNMG